jgi:hypothetical protein
VKRGGGASGGDKPRFGSRGTRVAAKLHMRPITGQRLAELLGPTPFTPQPEERKPMIPACDPWPDAKRVSFGATRADDPASAPQGWAQLNSETRVLVGGVLIALLDEFPDRATPANLQWLANRAWQRARRNRDVERDLGRTDLDTPNPLHLLEQAIRKLLAMANVEQSLRRRAAALDAQIAALAQRRRPTGATGATPGARGGDA